MRNVNSMLQELRQKAKDVLEIADALEKELLIQTESSDTTDTATKDENVSQKEISLSEIKMVLMEKSRAGYDAEVHALIKSYGVPKLSAIDKSFYPELLQKAEVIGNA